MKAIVIFLMWITHSVSQSFQREINLNFVLANTEFAHCENHTREHQVDAACLKIAYATSQWCDLSNCE